MPKYAFNSKKIVDLVDEDEDLVRILDQKTVRADNVQIKGYPTKMDGHLYPVNFVLTTSSYYYEVSIYLETAEIQKCDISSSSVIESDVFTALDDFTEKLMAILEEVESAEKIAAV